MAGGLKTNKSEEPINYPAGNLLAHFKRYVHNKEINERIF